MASRSVPPVPPRRQQVNDGLSREEFTEERIRGLMQEMGADAFFPILTEEEREQRRRQTLATLRPGEDLWLFAYGSLMWNPACHIAESRPGRIYGYHRRFCLWTPIGRGTPEVPGMMLALEPGGACRGLALRIAAEHVESESRIVWRREMLSGAYHAVWVNVHCDGEVVRALTFAINRQHPRYAGEVAEAEMVAAIATACGRLGRCRDYLHNLVLHLDSLGIADGPMHRLYEKVERHGC